MCTASDTAFMIAGRSLEALAEASFEEVLYLCLNGQLPSARSLAPFDAELKFFRGVQVGILNAMKLLPRQGHPLSHLRTAVSMLGIFEVDGEDTGRAAEQAKAQHLCAQIPTLVAAVYRIGEGKEPIPPRRDLSHAENFLFMVLGRTLEAPLPRRFESLLVLLAAAPLDDSSRSARHVAATGSDLHSALSGALAALKGPLGAGADEGVMRLLLEARTPERLEEILRRLPPAPATPYGFGSRPDPRIDAARALAEDVAILTGDRTWCDLARAMEQRLGELRPELHPVLDLYSAVILYQLGLPFEVYAPITAMARVPGWTATVRAARLDAEPR